MAWVVLVSALALAGASYAETDLLKLVPEQIRLPQKEFVLAGKAGPAAAGKAVSGPPPTCEATVGNWCREFWTQAKPVPVKPPPRGSKDCPSTAAGMCNGVGVCHYGLGVCQCNSGWKGDGCAEPDKRPCTHRLRSREDPYGVANSHMDPVTHEDLNVTHPGWTPSRCVGYCDDDYGFCLCGGNSSFGHKPIPGKRLEELPSQGRPIVHMCQPKETPTGQKLSWGMIKYARLYGAEGWCNAKHFNHQLTQHCGCVFDGWGGEFCQDRHEATCLNQCSGHGDCIFGWCKCHEGWYGTDCGLRKAGLPITADDLVETRPWIRRTMRHSVAVAAAVPTPELQKVAAQEPQAQGGEGAARRPDGERDPPHVQLRMILQQQKRHTRPLIYVYDLPSIFNTRILQYSQATCFYRHYSHANVTTWHTYAYTQELVIHEALLQSPHRTLDPEEADFFYVPVYIACFMSGILGYADTPYFGAPDPSPRPMQAAFMMLEAKRWLQKKMPWWDRRQGRDHIWLMPHDEGACYAPNEIFNTSIILTHWGRMDKDHTSNSGYGPDNYMLDLTWPKYMETNWREYVKGHPCYDPKKDLVIPTMKDLKFWDSSPLSGAAPLKRDILMSFRGDTGIHRGRKYSRGIRQRFYELAHENKWWTKYKIAIGSGSNFPGDYGEILARSVFCLYVPGDGFSTRGEDCISHGSIPVVVMDNVHGVFESILDYSKIAVRIAEADIERTPEILAAIPHEKVLEMQRAVAAVWHRMVYVSTSTLRFHLAHQFRDVRHRDRAFYDKGGAPKNHPFQPNERFPVRNDALGTIIAWLHSRIPNTR